MVPKPLQMNGVSLAPGTCSPSSLALSKLYISVSLLEGILTDFDQKSLSQGSAPI